MLEFSFYFDIGNVRGRFCYIEVLVGLLFDELIGHLITFNVRTLWQKNKGDFVCNSSLITYSNTPKPAEIQSSLFSKRSMWFSYQYINICWHLCSIPIAQISMATILLEMEVICSNAIQSRHFQAYQESFFKNLVRLSPIHHLAWY